MSLETLEFVIHPDGRVEETVTGITGKSCEEVTAAIEAQLGRIVETRKTSDFFAQAKNTVQGSDQVANQQSAGSQW